MKKQMLLLLAIVVQANLFAKSYFPEGTRWTEIRLDTLKYDSWYSKVDGEWLPNFETIEYYVQGEYVEHRYQGQYEDYNHIYACVYTNGPEWADSLSFLVNKGKSEEGIDWGGEVTVPVFDIDNEPVRPGFLYPFTWDVGDVLTSLAIIESSTTGFWPWDYDEYGTVEEIKEGYIGGVRPLKYSDVNGLRFIQTVGVTTWNDGECIFGPIRPYEVLSAWGAVEGEQRHYRSMLVRFERDGEVLYDVWPRKGSTVEVAIDGLNYFLYLNRHEAVITTNSTCSGELDIPSEVTYEGETFVVKSMFVNSFYNNTELTKVRIPKTIENILHSYPYDSDDEDPPTGMVSSDHMNPFRECTALEAIEVDEENPSFKSINGVLFSQDGVGHYYYLTNEYYGTGLYCYPAGRQQEAYSIPDGVEWIGANAFEGSRNLTTLTIPNSITHIYSCAFQNCNNLTDVYCYADNVPITWDYAFKDTPIASATLHVPAVSIEAYKAKAPWKDFGNIVGIFEEYYPEGTRWTEIRLDTLKYDSWYSKVDGEWLPNFETIEYYVQGENTDGDWVYKKVYTNGPEWADSLTLLLLDGYDDCYNKDGNNVYVTVPDIYEEGYIMWPGLAYQFDWSIGKELYYTDIMDSNSTGMHHHHFYYGIIDEIKEGDFGGVRPLTYVDLDGQAGQALYDEYSGDWNHNTNGGRIIHGIGITEWNSGECLFGPPNPYSVMTYSADCRPYRSMLVHFERDGEVLYDVWPEKGTDIKEYVTYTEGQMATIILPTTPDASKGKYYRLDRVEDERIVFEQELHPLAHVPYIIVPNEDFNIDLSTLDLAGCYRDTVSVDGISFIGSFVSEAFDYQEGFYIDFIDTTPDCRYDESCVIGALRAYLLVRWDDPYNQGGTKVPPLEKLEILLYDVGTGINNVDVNENGDIYDLQGRKLDKKTQPGIYIKNGKKVAK